MTKAEQNEIIDRIARRFEIVQKKLMEIIGLRIGEIADGLDVSSKSYIDIKSIQDLYDRAIKYSDRDVNTLLMTSGRDTFADNKAVLKAAGVKVQNWQASLEYLSAQAKAREVFDKYRAIAASSAISDTYKTAIDSAVRKFAELKLTPLEIVRKNDFLQVMRSTITSLGSAGLSKVEYASGRKIRIDSAVRQALRDGTTYVAQSVLDSIGSETGADGVEISAHENCAPDHAPYQGRQYTIEEFQKLQATLARPIGKYNCRHLAYPVKLGESERAYTDDDLKRYAKENKDGVNWNGKHYTGYEATQYQRKIETAIRDLKNAREIASSANDSAKLVRVQKRINTLETEYRQFSKKANLVNKLKSRT